MTFLQPWWWLLALLAVPLVLWQGRAPRAISVPTLRIWRLAGFAERPSAARVRKPRLTVPLALLLAALLSLTLALTGPRPAGAVTDHRVLVLDRSASMAADAGEGTRFDLAAQEVRDELEALPRRGRGAPRLSFLTVGPEFRIHGARLEQGRRTAVEALEAMHPSTGPDSVPWARLAEVVGGLRVEGESLAVTVFTDGAAAEAARQALEPLEVDVEVRAFGPSTPSLGLAAVRAVRLEDGSQWRIEGDLVAFPPTEGSVRIQATFTRADVEGELPWEEIEVEPEGPRTEFALETQVPSAGLLVLRVNGTGIPPDDVARVYLRDAPTPLRVLVAGEVPGPLTDAVTALEGAHVSVESAAAADATASFDLALVGPGASLADRPAPVVLWLAGAAPAEPYERRSSPRGSFVAGSDGAAAWSAVEDFPGDALDVVYDVPRLPGSRPLLHDRDDGDALLQVRNDGTLIDVVAAWPLGATDWVRELGFATFVSELARAAVPRHGAWTGTRCIVGRPCPPVGGVAPEDALGLHDAAGVPWTVDGEAGGESDLRVAGGQARGDLAAGRFPWRRLDRALAVLAAVLLAAEGMWAWWRRRRLAEPATGPQAILARGGRIGAVLALGLLAVGVPFPWLASSEAPVLVLGTEAWRDGSELPASLRDVLERSSAVVRAERWGRLVPADAALREDAEPGDVPAGYDPAAVVDMAAGSVGDLGGRITLAGVDFTHFAGDERQLAALRSQEIVVDVLPAPPPAPDEAWAAPLGLPHGVHAGDAVHVRPTAGGPAAEQHAVQMRVDGREVGVVGSGDAGDARVSFDAGEAGVREVRVELVGPAGTAMNDARTELLPVAAGARVLVVTPEGMEASVAAERFGGDAVEVETQRAEWMPVDVEEFLDTDVVVLLDVAAADLHRRQQEALETWVREHGGGVLIAGAERAYGPGGYFRTPLEQLSPLSARVPGEQPQAAVAFVIDRSGSMQQTAAGISRLDVAKEATVAAADLLHPASVVSLVVFDDVATLLRPLGPPESLASVLAPVTPGGGTNLYPALEAAYGQLRGSDAEAKHIVVLTDGLAQPAPFDPLVERIAASDITISTVGIGSDAGTTLLQGIARSAGGVYHATTDVSSLPSILSQEAMLLSGSPVREGPVEPAFDPGPEVLVKGLGETFPEVGGWVRTTRKPEASVHATTPSGDPVLASWRHGVGRVVALATPLTGPWAASWAGGPFANDLLAQAFRWLRSPVVEPGVSLRLHREGDALVAIADVVSAAGEVVEGANLTAEVTGPAGAGVERVAFADVGAGRYAARLPAHDPGRYRVEVVPRDVRSVREERSAAVEHEMSFPQALAPSSAVVGGAALLAHATGGEVIAEGAEFGRSATLRIVMSSAPGPWASLAVALVVLGLASGRLGRLLARRPERDRTSDTGTIGSRGDHATADGTDA